MTTLTFTDLNVYLNAAEDCGYFLCLTTYVAFDEDEQQVGQWAGTTGTLSVPAE